MIQRKSILNPNAAPYIPLANNFPGINFEGEHKAPEMVPGDSGERDDIRGTAGYQCPGTVFGAYDIKNADGVSVSVASSNMVNKTMVTESNTFIDEIAKHNVMVDTDLILDSLSSMFPDISRDSLAELLKANHGDLSETIYMLEQLESEDGFDIPGSSGIGNKLDDEGNSSGTSCLI